MTPTPVAQAVAKLYGRSLPFRQMSLVDYFLSGGPLRSLEKK